MVVSRQSLAAALDGQSKRSGDSMPVVTPTFGCADADGAPPALPLLAYLLIAGAKLRDAESPTRTDTTQVSDIGTFTAVSMLGSPIST